MYRSLQSTFEERARKIHNGHYKYPNISNITNQLSRITIECTTCSKHFEQQVKVHLRGSGCPFCGRVKTTQSRTLTNEKFINKAKLKEKCTEHRFIYDEVVYKGHRKKIILKCAICEYRFERVASAHLSKMPGCKKCAINKQTSSTGEFIEKAIQIHGNRYGYDDTEYSSAIEEVDIICYIHGKYRQTPNSHLSGHGCGRCGGRVVTDRESFLIASKNIHGNMYDYSSSHYTNSITPTTIICRIHGPFEQRPNNHLQGGGCDGCARGVWILDKNIFIQEAEKVHGRQYDYSQSNYLRMGELVQIHCKLHGLFTQTPSNHITHRQGCPECGRERRRVKRSTDYTLFIKRALERHGEQYDYTRVTKETFTNGLSSRIKIRCSEHGEFEITATSHLNKRGKGGCWECHRERMRNDRSFTDEQFVERSVSIHGEGRFSYGNVVYINNSQAISVRCEVHSFDFVVTPVTHWSSFTGGCARCSEVGCSAKQIEWLEFMSGYLDVYIQHKKNEGEFRIPGTNYRVDGFVSPKTVYEFYGDWWHGHPYRYDPYDFNALTGKRYIDLYEDTLKREDDLRDKGYTVINVWESNWDNAKKIVSMIQKKWRLKNCSNRH